MIERHLITDRASWLTLRKKTIGASEIAALFGCHPYRTAFEVYADKTTGANKRVTNQDTLTSGQLLEPVVAQRVCQERPDWQVHKYQHWLHAPEWGLSATPDFYVRANGRTGILQAKTVDPWAFRDEWTEEMPLQWIVLQTLQEMLLAEVSWGIIAAMEVSRELPLHIYEFEVNQAAQARLISAAKLFWADVAAGKAPAPDYSRDGDILKALHAKDNGVMLDLTGNNRLPELLAEYERLSDGIKGAKSAEKALKTIETEIRAVLGDALGATLPGWHVQCPTISRKGYTVESTTYRTLKIKRTQPMEDAA